MLKAKHFLNDPRIEQAKTLVLEALKDHQQEMTGPHPKDEALEKEYNALLASFAALRGNTLWYPYLGSGFGKGALVELLDGSVKYDFISGIGVHYFGHSHPEIIETSFLGALSDTVMEGHLQQNKDAADLSKLLIEKSGLAHCFLSSSGAMANENALKIAFHKRAPAHRVLAFEGAFTGRTLALAQITDKAAYREGLPENLMVDHIPFYDSKDPIKSRERTLKALEKVLKRHPGLYAVMIIELIQGEGGFYTGDKAFFHQVIDLLKEHKVAVFIDEVQSFGRTPSLFAFQHFELEGKVDIVTIGKLSQICATLFTQEFCPKPGLLSQTFTASVTAIRAALYIIKTLSEKNFYGPSGRIEKIHHRFKTALENLQKKYPEKINGPWGLGAMIAFTYKTGDYKETIDFAKKLFDEGLIVFINGTNPTRIRMLPPALVITDDEIDSAFRIIATCL